MTKPDKDDVLRSSGSAESKNGAQEGTDPVSAPVSPDNLEEGNAEKIIVEAAEVVADTAEEMLAKAQEEISEWQGKYMRLHAEWDTYRRRTAEQRSEERIAATQKLVENILPILDDFERTIDYAVKNGEGSLLDGVRAVKTKLEDALEKEGVETINPQGEAFDALECQAVNTVDDKKIPEETVTEVFQKGYKMGRKVLRPAMVTVSMGGPKRVVPDE